MMDEKGMLMDDEYLFFCALNSGTRTSFHCFVDLKKTQEMHSRESARVVRQILPAAQGIVARHAVPRLQNLAFQANPGVKLPHSYHQLLF